VDTGDANDIRSRSTGFNEGNLQELIRHGDEKYYKER
jgi:hypothetical protein